MPDSREDLGQPKRVNPIIYFFYSVFDQVQQPNFFADLRSSFGNFDLWGYLGWQDIRLKYRRSRIGPLWITISMGVFSIALAFLYSSLFKTDLKTLLPFLCTGFILWGFFSGILIDCPNLFTDNAHHIKDMKTNPMDLLLRLCYRHFLVLLHHLLIVVLIYLWFQITVTANLLWFIPGIILVGLNITSVGLILSICGARFRDIPPIVQSILQLLFFVSPVTWMPSMIPAEQNWLIEANPFSHFLNLTRDPLLGLQPPVESWLVATFTLFSSLSISAILYNRKASRIAFWV